MKSITRFAIETVLLMVLAAGMLIAAIAVARYVFTDEKNQYFTIGYYVAIHANLVRWIWKRLGIEKKKSE